MGVQNRRVLGGLAAAGFFVLGLSGCATDPTLVSYKEKVAANPKSAEDHIALGVMYVKKRSYSMGHKHLQLGLRYSGTGGTNELRDAARAVYDALDKAMSYGGMSHRGQHGVRKSAANIQALNARAVAIVEGNRGAEFASGREPEPAPKPRVESSASSAGGGDALEDVLSDLQDPNWQTRAKAADRLGKIGDASAISDLIGKLRDPKYKVRSAAARALGRIGDPGVISVIQKRMWADQSPAVRGWAAWALGEIGDKRSETALKQALKDKNKYVRASAIEALEKMGLK